MDQQTQQTEKIVMEMLEFLDSSSDEGDDLDWFGKSQTQDDYLQMTAAVKKDNVSSVQYEKILNLQTTTANKIKSALTKELQELKQQYPIWNTKEIANGQAETSNYSSDSNNLDWHLKLETNCRRNSTSNSYIQEIQRAIYGDKTGHPPSGSEEYYQAAQDYLETILNEKNPCGSESSNLIPNLNSGLYPLNQGLGQSNIGKLNTTSAGVIAPPSCALTSGSNASSAAYYQMCNSVNPSRPTISNNTINSATYGIFLGNKVTYVATTPTAPSIIYNQHSKTTTNFISNSLANAALATSPAILYTNPMLTTTTQQYLNTFFKETQFLGAASLTANTATQATAITSNGTTGLYERLVYAQMLQQQLYHQTQQAAAVAAMFQHKHRAAVAAAAAVAASTRQQTNVAANVSRTSPLHFNTITTTSNGFGPIGGNSTNRQVTNGSLSSIDFIKTKQQTSTINNTSSTSSSANIESISE